MHSLEELILEAKEDGGYIVPGGRAKFFELTEAATARQWMCAAPMTDEEWANLESGEEYIPFGGSYAAMDAAIFQCSPDGEGEPVRERMIGGRKFINVAAPVGEINFAEDPNGMSSIIVNKTHVLGFEAGRTVKLLRLPGGLFVETIGKPDVDDELVLPTGAFIEEIELQRPWVVHLPKPTTTFWWFGQGRGFQGPITLPSS